MREITSLCVGNPLYTNRVIHRLAFYASVGVTLRLEGMTIGPDTSVQDDGRPPGGVPHRRCLCTAYASPYAQRDSPHSEGRHIGRIPCPLPMHCLCSTSFVIDTSEERARLDTRSLFERGVPRPRYKDSTNDFFAKRIPQTGYPSFPTGLGSTQRWVKRIRFSCQVGSTLVGVPVCFLSRGVIRRRFSACSTMPAGRM